MPEHLWPLLRLQAETDDELKEVYRQIYLDNYVKTKDGEEIKIFDWLGNRVHFNPHKNFFEHAFTESSNYRFSSGIHDTPLSKRRARCILWIKEVLAASAGTIERRHQVRKDSRGRKCKRRTLIVVEEKYVVVLEERPNPGELEFITAFPADESYIENLRKESYLIETKKPQS